MLETKVNIHKEQIPAADITLMDAVEWSTRLFRRQWRVIVSSAVLLTSLGTLYAVLATPRYTARAVVDSDLARQEILPPQQQPLNSAPIDPTEVDSQVEVFKSSNVLLPVVEQLKLREDPGFLSGGLLSILFGRRLKGRDEQAQLQRILDRLDKSLEVRRVGKTHVIEVLFTDRSPDRAAELANAIANSFIQDRLQAKYEAAQKAIAWLQNRLAELRKQASAAEEAVARFKSSHPLLDAEAVAPQSEKEAQAKLRELENRAKSFRTTYDDNANFLQRDVEQLQQQSMPTSGARIISLALPPLKASYPRTSLAIGGGALAGLILGFAIALFRDIADRVFRTREHVEKSLGLHCISLVPNLAAPSAKRTRRNKRSNKPESQLDGSDFAPAFNVEAFASTEFASPETRERPTVTHARRILEPVISPFSEAMQTIRLSIDQFHARSTNLIIGVTSTLPNEGKSTIAANLAQTIARTDQRVLLVDCDFRAATLTKIFAEQSPVGLEEILIGQVSIEEAVRHKPAGFMFLAAGAVPGLRHPNEIFASARTRCLFEDLRKLADYILVDLPPIGPFTDAQAISSLVDSYVLVIEWGKTQTRIIENTLNRADCIRDQILGVVLNKVDFDSLADYEDTYVRMKATRQKLRVES